MTLRNIKVNGKKFSQNTGTQLVLRIILKMMNIKGVYINEMNPNMNLLCACFLGLVVLVIHIRTAM